MKIENLILPWNKMTAPIYSITKVADWSTVSSGGSIIYTITISNTGALEPPCYFYR